MVQLLLLLLGVQAVRRHWQWLALIGAAWIALGLIVVIDPLERAQKFTMHILGELLVLEGAVVIIVWVLNSSRRQLSFLRAAALILPGLLIIDTPWRNVVLISCLFGLALTADGVIRLASTLLMRFPGWRWAVAGSLLEVGLALLAFTPWPVSYEATIPFCVGVALILSGWAVLRSGLLLRRLPPDAPITSLPIFRAQRGWHVPVALGGPQGAADLAEKPGPRMIVHVWTAVASAASPRANPLINRYIAAVDANGTVSTGHAALEMPPDLYISHYGASDQDRTGKEFLGALNAGRHNDVQGRFLPSYRSEVAEWCEANEHVVFRRFDAERLRLFWSTYRQDPTYNLTNRNCSVAVALALDVALEGVIGRRRRWLPPRVLRLVMHPDLYLATLLRKRAHTMTWTPGLVLDYARALHRVVEPPSLSWPAMVRQTFRAYRRSRGRQTAGAGAPASDAKAAKPGVAT
jgi:uncharacterized membrane protein HdeD (DUF308 family)